LLKKGRGDIGEEKLKVEPTTNRKKKKNITKTLKHESVSRTDTKE